MENERNAAFTMKDRDEAWLNLTSQAPVWTRDVDGDLDRTTIEVPMDYADPAGSRITIALSRAPATSSSGRRGVLISCNGGPGGDSGDGVRLPAMLGPSLRERYDVIGFDPRGTGDSTPLYGEVSVPQAPFDSRPRDEDLPRIVQDMQERERACARAGGEFRQHVTTRNVARDLDLIREILDEEHISFVGWAYGTALGAVYATMFPGRLDRVVLDSCVHPNWSWRTQFGTQADTLRVNVNRWANWVGERDGAFGLGTGSAAVLDVVEEVALGLESIDDHGSVRLRTLFDGAVGRKATDRVAWEVLARLVSDAASALRAGDTDSARSLVESEQQWRPQDSVGNLRIAVLDAVTLESEWDPDVTSYLEDMKRVRESGPYGFAVLRVQPWVGTFRSFESLEPQTRITGPLPAPVLVVQSDGDPFDSPLGGRAMAEVLGARYVEVVDSGEHEIYRLGDNPRVDEIVDRYLFEGELPEKDLELPGAVGRPNVPADRS